MKTLHFFTEYYQPACNSTSFYITRIIHACAKAWDGALRVYCATDNNAPEQLQGEHICITRFKGGKLNKNSLVSRLWKFMLITLKFSGAAFWNIRRNDVVFAVTNPAFMLVFLAFLRKIRKFRFILLVYDIFPEVLIPGGLTTEKSIKYRLSLAIFNWAYNSADTLIVIGRDMQDVVTRKIQDSSRIVFIPNWSDTEKIVSIPKDENPILKRFGVENNFVFSATGNIGRTQGLDNIIEALALNPLDDNSVFLFMGGGAMLGKLKQKVEQQNLRNVRITGWISEDEQNAMLNACDVAVISLTAGMYGLSVPSKTYFNMAAAKPLLLIADSDSEIARMIRGKKIGWCVAPNNPEALAKTLREIQRIPPSTLKQYAQRARKIAEECFCEEKILKQYQNTICGIQKG